VAAFLPPLFPTAVTEKKAKKTAGGGKILNSFFLT